MSTNTSYQPIENSTAHSARSYIFQLLGPAVTIALVATIDISRLQGSPFPTPFLLLYASVILAANLGGGRSGIASGAIASAFIVSTHIFSDGGQGLTMGFGAALFGSMLYLGTGWLCGQRSSRTSNEVNHLRAHIVERAKALEKQDSQAAQLMADLRQANLLNREYDERLNTILGSTGTSILELDSKEIANWLQGEISGLLKHSTNDYAGTPFAPLLRDEQTNIRGILKAVLQDSRHSMVYTHEDHIYDIKLLPKKSTTGQVVGIYGIATDITERLQAERLRIEIAQDRELVDLKSRFITTASHNFRTPLTVISTGASLLEAHYDQLDPERRQRILSRTLKQVDKLNRILKDLLTVNNASAERIEVRNEEINLNIFCDQSWQNFASSTAHTDLKLEYNATIDTLSSDPTLIRKVLRNVLTNASTFTPESKQIALTVTSDKQFVNFKVRDQGMGIPSSELPRVFEPFHRGRNVKNLEGNGIGLTLAKLYIDALGGYIHLQNNEGDGVTCLIQVPLSTNNKSNLLF